MAQVQELGAATELKFDQYVGDPYREKLYRYDNCATGIASIDEFSDEHVAFYRETGFLVIHGVFTDREVESALAGFTDLVIGKHPDFVGVQFEAASKKYVRTLSQKQQLDCVRKLQHFVQFEPRMEAMAWHPNLQRVVSRLLEAEPEIFADQARKSQQEYLDWLETGTASSIAKIEAEGGVFKEFPASELAKWVAATPDLLKGWEESMAERGFGDQAKEVRAAWREWAK